jgi:hypothetical protein
MWGEIPCNVFMLLFVVLWVLIFAMLIVWLAFLFNGLTRVGLFPLFSFCFVVSLLFLVRNF